MAAMNTIKDALRGVALAVGDSRRIGHDQLRSSAVPLEQPPKVSKTALRNWKPVTSPRPPDGNGG